MIIEYNIDKYLVSDLSTVSDAIVSLGKSKERIVLCLNSSRKLTGILTNGDLLRWLAGSEERDFNQGFSLIMNKQFQKVYESDLIRNEYVNELTRKYTTANCSLS